MLRACDEVYSREVKDEKTEDIAAVVPQKYVKHPLQNKWSLWFFKNDKQKSWTENLRIVTSFDTVSFLLSTDVTTKCTCGRTEVYNHIQLASKLSSGCDYSLFK
ncbi:hypothetical protein QZH41_015155, partial [Actinostola sp. cb2023]